MRQQLAYDGHLVVIERFTPVKVVERQVTVLAGIALHATATDVSAAVGDEPVLEELATRDVAGIKELGAAEALAHAVLLQHGFARVQYRIVITVALRGGQEGIVAVNLEEHMALVVAVHHQVDEVHLQRLLQPLQYSGQGCRRDDAGIKLGNQRC